MKHPTVSKLLLALAVKSSMGYFSLKDGLIKYKNRIWVEGNEVVQTKICHTFHSSAMGVSLEFIEGLSKSKHYNCILVVVDKFSKYSHFILLTHPLTALQVAVRFMDHVLKLHGMP